MTSTLAPVPASSENSLAVGDRLAIDRIATLVADISVAAAEARTVVRKATENATEVGVLLNSLRDQVIERGENWKRYYESNLARVVPYNTARRWMHVAKGVLTIEHTSAREVQHLLEIGSDVDQPAAPSARQAVAAELGVGEDDTPVASIVSHRTGARHFQRFISSFDKSGRALTADEREMIALDLVGVIRWLDTQGVIDRARNMRT